MCSAGGCTTRLLAHDWRGNVRELRNIAERHVLGLGRKGDGLGGLLDAREGKPVALPDQLALIEAELIRSALDSCNGQMQVTADRLGIPRRTLNEKIRKYHLELPNARRGPEP